jgi:dynein heavy chain
MKLRRANHVSPKHFLDFQNTYVELFRDKLQFITALCKRLADGIKKIADAKVEIEALNRKLVRSKKRLDEKNRACDLLLKEIETRTIEATEKKAIAIEKSKELEIQNVIILKDKAEAELILQDALPALELARLALDDLEKADIVEIRSFTTPPKAVQVVCECVLALKGIKESGWKASKIMMSDNNFLKSLMELDVDNITKAQHARVTETLTEANKTMKMTVEALQKVSKAGAGLYKFVEAVMGFCVVNFEVKPKKDALAKLVYVYNKAKAELEKTLARVKKLEDELEMYQKKYDEAMMEKKILEEEFNILMVRLSNAKRLISGA